LKNLYVNISVECSIYENYSKLWLRITILLNKQQVIQVPWHASGFAAQNAFGMQNGWRHAKKMD